MMKSIGNPTKRMLFYVILAFLLFGVTGFVSYQNSDLILFGEHLPSEIDTNKYDELLMNKFDDSSNYPNEFIEIVVNNTEIALVIILFSFLLGLPGIFLTLTATTIYQMAILSYFIQYHGLSMRSLLLLTAPHGIFELSGFFILMILNFVQVYRWLSTTIDESGKLVFDANESLLARRLIEYALILIWIASIVETFITPLFMAYI